MDFKKERPFYSARKSEALPHRKNQGLF